MIRTFEKSAIVASAVLLAACQTTQPAVQVREVEVPVPVPCLSRAQMEEDRFQEPPLVGDRLTGDEAVDLSIVSASALLLRAWGKELLAAHEGCASVD